ncbi:hypothetical protein K8O92_07465 [Nocardia asteroides]|nr:hypothetical protein K8O92_07465 [Nocardia asteroides]
MSTRSRGSDRVTAASPDVAEPGLIADSPTCHSVRPLVRALGFGGIVLGVLMIVVVAVKRQ